MKKVIKAGATDQTIDIFVQDSSSTTGAGLTGLAYNTASLVCYYRKGATGSATALTLATQTVGGAHSDGGFVEISSANMPGMYRLDLSDTIVDTAGTVSLMLKGATNMAPLPIELQIVSYDPNDGVRLGLTALPNAAAEAAGGLFTRGTGAGQINQAANGNIDCNTVKLAGTAQTGRDLGASVLLSSGTGAGQLDFTSGVVKANLAQILGTALTETAGQIAAAFKKFFNVATPTGTVNSLPDAVAGANNGLPTTNGTKLNQTVDLTAGQSIEASQLGTQAKADVNAEVDSALNTAIPGSPTADSINERIAAIDNLTQASGGGDLAAMKTQLADVHDTDLPAVKTETASIQSDTNDLQTQIGVAGAGLTALGDARLVNLDATVSSRLAPAGTLSTVTNLTNAPTAGDLTAAMKASINTEVADNLGVDTIAEMAQGIPPATPTVIQALMYLYMTLRNQLTTTATEKAIYNNAGTKIAKKVLSDDATTYTEAKMISGA